MENGFIICYKCNRKLIPDDDYIHIDEENNMFCRDCFSDDHFKRPLDEDELEKIKEVLK
ncbi:MAG: hypothetical protein GY714_13515 [Desulfobacterales bacterium]|nr:hypothetical protein [Desulfobacterales bacterium]MCP4158564.1 hypothetical protein [Deltaproteobacteria bacterium]